MNHQSFSRRTFLRGVGVSMALPWMESLRVWGDEAKAVARRERGPGAAGGAVLGQRFPRQGMVGQGRAAASMELGQVLAPLADFRERMLFIRGLYNAEAQKGNIHSSQTGNLLSGAPLASGGEIRSGTSFDQLLAQPTASRPRCRASCSAAKSRTRRCTRTTRCSTARTFRGPRRRRRRRWSFIPRWPSTGCSGTRSSAATRACSTPCWPTPATSAAQSARPISASSTNISTRSARSKQRIERAGQRGELQGWRPTLDKPNIPRPADGIPQDIGEHMRLMCDILVLGFQTDTTRICTLKLNNDHSSLRFPNLGVDYMIHHLLSHSDTADWLKVNQFFLEQVAYIARKLDGIHEGDRTALDNSKHAAGLDPAAAAAQHDHRQAASRRGCRSACSNRT